MKPLQRKQEARVFRRIPTLTYVETVIRPTDKPLPDIELARDELREGMAFSRHLVRQSHVLIELTESDGAFPNDNDDLEFGD
jgi:hypothetical protein